MKALFGDRQLVACQTVPLVRVAGNYPATACVARKTAQGLFDRPRFCLPVTVGFPGDEQAAGMEFGTPHDSFEIWRYQALGRLLSFPVEHHDERFVDRSQWIRRLVQTATRQLRLIRRHGNRANAAKILPLPAVVSVQRLGIECSCDRAFLPIPLMYDSGEISRKDD